MNTLLPSRGTGDPPAATGPSVNVLGRATPSAETAGLTRFQPPFLLSEIWLLLT